MALSSINSDPAEAILELVRGQFNGTVTISLDDAEFGAYDSHADEREVVKPATVLIEGRHARVKFVNTPRVVGNSFSKDAQWACRVQFEIQPDDPFIPKNAILRVDSHTRDHQLVGQNFQVSGSFVSSLIDLRTVIGVGEVHDGSQ